MMKKLLSLGIIGVLTFMFTTPAYALTVGSDTDTGVNMKANGSVRNSDIIETRLDTEVNAETNANIDANTDESDPTSSEEEVKNGDSAEVDGEVSNSLNLRINRGDVMSSDRNADDTTGIEADTRISTAAQVMVEEDFEAFTRNIIRADENVKTVVVNENSVAVTYQHNGKLLGFIPVPVDVTIDVNTEGEVDVDYSWYRFLTSVDTADVETEIESRVEASVDGALTLQDRAEIVSIVNEVLQSSFQAETDVNAEVDVSTELQTE